MRAETRQPVRQLVQTEPCGSMRNDTVYQRDEKCALFLVAEQ